MLLLKKTAWSRGNILTDGRSLIAFCLPFVLYVLTLAPTVYNLDSAELTTAAATGGIMRSTGYPLYMMIGWCWSHLPLGDVGYRFNLFSAFTGALTIMLVERVMRYWHINSWAKVGAVGLLACAPSFWSLSLVAEVYTLHTALMSGLLLALLRWEERPTPKRLALVFLLMGLGLSHHVATLLLLPGCAWYLLTTAPRQVLHARMILVALVFLLVGLSPYLYLPLRYLAQPAFNYAGSYDSSGLFHPINLTTAKGLWWLISGRIFADKMFAYNLTELWGEMKLFVRLMWQSFFAIGIGPGLLGIAMMFRYNWRVGGMLLFMFLSNTLFYLNYRVLDKATMFLPSFLIWTIWLAMGYHWLLEWIKDTGPVRFLRLSVVSVQTIMVGAVLMASVITWPKVNLSQDWSTRRHGEMLLEQMENDALFLGFWDTVPIIQYLQLVEGQGLHVQAINRFFITHEDLHTLIAYEIEQRPVYIDLPPNDLPPAFQIEAAGSIYRLVPGRHSQKTSVLRCCQERGEYCEKVGGVAMW